LTGDLLIHVITVDGNEAAEWPEVRTHESGWAAARGVEE
jgi:hypothetical protein